jgi:hypothetical protein
MAGRTLLSQWAILCGSEVTAEYVLCESASTASTKSSLARRSMADGS